MGSTDIQYKTLINDGHFKTIKTLHPIVLSVSTQLGEIMEALKVQPTKKLSGARFSPSYNLTIINEIRAHFLFLHLLN